MSRKTTIGTAVSVDEQAFERGDDDDAVVEGVPEFRASVEMEIQAKVDANHPDARIEDGPGHLYGQTLAQEERIRAREAELERISERGAISRQHGRERRSRSVAARRSAGRRRSFQKRAASVDPHLDPARADPRERLDRRTLADVNTQAGRMAERLGGWSRAAISRRLAEVVREGGTLQEAVIAVYDELETAPGQVVPIGRLEGISRQEVSIEGRVKTLWEPSNTAIQAVGLIADESGKTKFTVWQKSNQPWIEEGERVRLLGVSKTWYNGRVSVALTGWSTVLFMDRGAWWSER